MTVWSGLSPSTQAACLALVGVLGGALVNWAIYALAYRRRAISPWSRRDPSAPPRGAADRVPVVGWFGLRRESGLWGRGHWVRPLLLEVALAVALPALYFWELGGHLFPVGIAAPTQVAHAQFVVHAVLLLFLTAATFIDFDERTIPDSITVPGTLLGHLLLTWLPFAFLPVGVTIMGQPEYEPLMAARRHEWPPDWDAERGLLLGLACFAGWCFAIAPKVCTLRYGMGRGVRYFFASLWRYNVWWRIPLLWAIGSMVIMAVWGVAPPAAWRGLLSSLVGAALAGAFAWLIRTVVGLSLGREALGFGDVTLMAMIGASIGWQAGLLSFFAAPFAALVIIALRRAVSPYFEIAFGPYLALGAAAIVVGWRPVWERTQLYFALSGLLFAALLVCLLPLTLILLLLRRLRGE